MPFAGAWVARYGAFLPPVLPARGLYPTKEPGMTAIGQNSGRILGAGEIDHVGQLTVRPTNAPHPRVFAVRNDFNEDLTRFAIV